MVLHKQQKQNTYFGSADLVYFRMFIGKSFVEIGKTMIYLKKEVISNTKVKFTLVSKKHERLNIVLLCNAAEDP